MFNHSISLWLSVQMAPGYSKESSIFQVNCYYKIVITLWFDQIIDLKILTCVRRSRDQEGHKPINEIAH